MRCPKCSYISFDHLETCKKCHKYIGDVLAEINGTTYGIEVPLFLKIASTDGATPPLSFQNSQGNEAKTLVERDDTFEFGESEDSDFVLDQEFELEPERKEIEFPQSGEDLAMAIDDDTTASSPPDAFTLDLSEQSDDMKSPLPALDFGDLDISDLAPPIKEESGPIQFTEKPVLSDLEPVARLSPQTPHPSPQPASKTPSGLEDLNFNGLDLDTPAKLASGSTAGKRFLPSVKTGTALDKFDIDLGDLFTENKK